MIYVAPAEPDVAQGDVLDECPIVHLARDATLATVAAGVQVVPQRVIVLTQTCDLAQEKTSHVVVAVVHPADELVAMGLFKAATVRDQVRTARTFGWYYLPADAAVGLPESLVELRDLHTVPMTVIRELVQTGKRVARLAVPYREHLAQHFAVTYMRVALPDPYPTTP